MPVFERDGSVILFEEVLDEYIKRTGRPHNLTLESQELIKTLIYFINIAIKAQEKKISSKMLSFIKSLIKD